VKADWTRIGPDPIVNCLTVSGTNIFAGTQGNGLMKSTNGGQNWTYTNGFGVVYSSAGSGTNLIIGTSGDGTWASFDGGNAFNHSVSGLTNLTIFSLVASGSTFLQVQAQAFLKLQMLEYSGRPQMAG